MDRGTKKSGWLKLPKIATIFKNSLLCALVGAIVGSILTYWGTMRIKEKQNEEMICRLVATSFNEARENQWALDNLWSKSQLERKLVYSQFEISSLERLSTEPLIYQYLKPYYTTDILPGMMRSMRVARALLRSLEQGMEMDDTLKALISNELIMQQGRMRDIGLSIMKKEKWELLTSESQYEGITKKIHHSILIR